MSILSGAGLEDLGNIGGCKPDTHAPLRCFGEPRLDVRPEPRKVSSALLVDEIRSRHVSQRTCSGDGALQSMHKPAFRSSSRRCRARSVALSSCAAVSSARGAPGTPRRTGRRCG